MLFKNRRRFLQLIASVVTTLGIDQFYACLQPKRSLAMTDPAKADNAELRRMFTEDQADRSPPEGQSIDWSIVSPRDQARLAQVKELYEADALHTGADYYHAAVILQHGQGPEDYLLAHEFCVVAIGKGEEQAKWLVAASEDRFLMSIDRPQRFGTQYRVEPDDPQGRMRLYRVDSHVTDQLRRELNVPTLAQAQEREQRFQQ